jgi:hypothetical protein
MVARVLGVPVVHVVTAGDDPHVRTRCWIGGPAEENIRWLRKLVLIDLAGAAIEDGTTANTDRANAWRRCREIIAIENGIAITRLDQLDEYQLKDAAALMVRLMLEAAKLLREHYPLIARAAHRLDDLGEMSGAQVDAIMLED